MRRRYSALSIKPLMYLEDLKSYGLNHCHPSRGPLIRKENLPAALLVRILPYKVQSFLLSVDMNYLQSMTSCSGPWNILLKSPEGRKFEFQIHFSFCA